MLIISLPGKFAEKEQLYIAARETEERIYTDEELKKLPDISIKHKYYREWVQRKRSLERLKKHLASTFRESKLNILELGCGNGWLSHQLSLTGHNVTGIDLNSEELNQAERVFGTSPSLKWVYADIFDPKFPTEKYDVIILAASCQYFPSLVMLTEQLKTIIKRGGQVHLIDSMFYSDTELQDARRRSFEYYTRIGHTEMSLYYYHHSKAVVKGMGYIKCYPTDFYFIKNKSRLEWWVLNC